jgi:hypothetical protein
LSFTEDEIVQKASRIGVSLGDDDISKRAVAKLILDSEVQRSFVMLKNNESLVDLEGDDRYNDLVPQATHLCDDFANEELYL